MSLTTIGFHQRVGSISPNFRPLEPNQQPFLSFRSPWKQMFWANGPGQTPELNQIYRSLKQSGFLHVLPGELRVTGQIQAWLIDQNPVVVTW